MAENYRHTKAVSPKHYLRLLEIAWFWNFDVSLLNRLNSPMSEQTGFNLSRNRNTHRLALSFSISLRSTSSAVNTSNRVLNSSASAQSLHTLLNGFGPLPSFGARPHPRPKPVLSFNKLRPLRSRGRSPVPCSSAVEG